MTLGNHPAIGIANSIKQSKTQDQWLPNLALREYQEGLGLDRLDNL